MNFKNNQVHEIKNIPMITCKFQLIINITGDNRLKKNNAVYSNQRYLNGSYNTLITQTLKNHFPFN